MTSPTPTDMFEATRLTREGRLEEAMALIQGRRVKRPSPATAPERPATAPPSPGFIDLTPPSPHTGDSWTAPTSNAGGTSHSESDEIMPGLHLSRVFHSLMSKWGHKAKEPADAPSPAPRKESQFVERAYSNAAGMRGYKLFIPPAHNGERLPLVIMLHGCTQSPDDFAAGTRMNEIAAAERFFVAYPAQDQRANSAKCWNWFNAGDQRRDQGEPSIIAGLTREIIREFNIDPKRVYVCGLSAGGAAAAVLGMTYPDLYAAVGIHSGLACGAAKDTLSAFAAMRQGAAGAIAAANSIAHKPRSAIVFHGDADKTVNPLNGEAIVAQFQGATPLAASTTQGQSTDGTRFTRTSHTAEGGQTVLEHWILHGCGHAWSGGSKAGSYTDPRGPDASREMIRFFSQQFLAG